MSQRENTLQRNEISRSCVRVDGQRAEQALTPVVAGCYLLGVSTRRMDKLVGTLGIASRPSGTDRLN